MYLPCFDMLGSAFSVMVLSLATSDQRQVIVYFFPDPGRGMSEIVYVQDKGI